MEITVNIEFTKEELWTLIENLPNNPQGTNKTLYERLTASRLAFERPLQVYGNGAKIKPVAVLNEYHNRESV